MQQAKAQLRYLRVTPRKTRLVADLIRGKRVEEALDILTFSRRRVAVNLRKLLKSAIANAESSGRVDPDLLRVSHISVDQGPTLKRSMPRARGSADRLEKKTSHVTLILEET